MDRVKATAKAAAAGMKACQSQANFIMKEALAQIREDICLTCGYCAAACPVRASNNGVRQDYILWV